MGLIDVFLNSRYKFPLEVLANLLPDDILLIEFLLGLEQGEAFEIATLSIPVLSVMRDVRFSRASQTVSVSRT
jgi:hypothetical protein